MSCCLCKQLFSSVIADEEVDDAKLTPEVRMVVKLLLRREVKTQSLEEDAKLTQMKEVSLGNN